MKRYLAWAAAILVLAVLGIAAYETVPWRLVIVERRMPSLMGSLVMWNVNSNVQGSSCFMALYEHPRYPIRRRLEINCLFKDNIEYREDTSDGFLGAIRLFDGAEHLITTWAGGSGYRVMVYHLANNAITKVLEAGTITAPGMRYNSNGDLVIETQLHGPDGGRENPINVVHVWDKASGQFRDTQ